MNGFFWGGGGGFSGGGNGYPGVVPLAFLMVKGAFSQS